MVVADLNGSLKAGNGKTQVNGKANGQALRKRSAQPNRGFLGWLFNFVTRYVANNRMAVYGGHLFCFVTNAVFLVADRLIQDRNLGYYLNTSIPMPRVARSLR